MSKFLDVSVNWDSGSSLERKEKRGIRQKSVNGWVACWRWIGMSSSLYLPVQNLSCSKQKLDVYLCIQYS